MPALASAAMRCGVDGSPARPSSAAPAACRAPRSARPRRRRSSAGSAPGHARPCGCTDRCGPSRCRPRKPGTFCRAASTPAATAAAVICGRVGDQRRQQRRRAERRMRRADRADRLDVGLVVEHDPAAAIDLQVDEARRKHAAARPRRRSMPVSRHLLRNDAPRPCRPQRPARRRRASPRRRRCGRR